MQPQAYQNRNEAMNEGINGGPTASPGLAQQQQSMAAEQPRGIRPSGTMNGMAAGQFQATMGGMFATQNAQAESTYDTKKYFEGRQQ